MTQPQLIDALRCLLGEMTTVESTDLLMEAIQAEEMALRRRLDGDCVEEGEE